MKFNLEGEDMRRKVAFPHGNSASIYVPKTWVGREVIVILAPKAVAE